MKERMELLLSAGVITQFACDATMNASKTLQVEWGVDLGTEQVQMAMTHFARAIDRIVTNEVILEGLCADILQEIAVDEVFPEIQRVNTLMCKNCGIENVPETENSFFISNLYSIFLNR